MGGRRREYIKYFCRADIQPLWAWIAESLANFLLVALWRRDDFGLYGAASLAALILADDTLFTADVDQERCFTNRDSAMDAVLLRGAAGLPA